MTPYWLLPITFLSLLPYQQDQDHHLSPCALESPPQPCSHVSCFPDLPWKCCWSPHGGAAVGNSLRARQALTVDNIWIWGPGKQKPHEETGQAGTWGQESLSSDHFSLSPGASVQFRLCWLGCSQALSATLAPNLFHSCKSADGVGVIFLEAENFHLSLSWNNSTQ